MPSKAKRTHRSRIGCSGWSYKEWRGLFYPEKLPQRLWLSHYAEHFSTVEVNATFYRLPTEKMVKRWVEETPDDFEFAVKGSRYMTHVYRLAKPEGVQLFWRPLAPLREAGKLGPILWQLPPNFQRDDERLLGFLDMLPEGRHCFEFRHESWFTPAVTAMLDAHDCSLVTAHDPRGELPVRSPCGPLAYVRFHYGEEGRRGNYSKAELTKWKRRLAGWRRKRDVYAYFNNDWEAFAPRDAAQLSGQAPPSL